MIGKILFRSVVMLNFLFWTGILMAAEGEVNLNVGDKAPDFVLNDQDGNLWNLKDYLGKKRHAPTWTEARRIEKNNYIKYGSHSISHPVLSKITDERSLNEITKSLDKLKTELNSPVNIFAYPFGEKEDFTAREVKYLEECGDNDSINRFKTGFSKNILSVLPEYMYYLSPMYGRFTEMLFKIKSVLRR